MAPNPRVLKAFRAMKAIGINEDKVKPVLKRLLKLYEKNWELIEEENYRVLADAIFDEEDTKVLDEKGNANEEHLEQEAQVDEEPQRPLKRLRLRSQEGEASPSLDNCDPRLVPTPLRKPKVEEEELHGTTSLLQQSPDMRKSQPVPVSPQNHTRNMGKQPVSPVHAALQGSSASNSSQHCAMDGTLSSESLSPQMRLANKGKEPALPQAPFREKRPALDRASHAVHFKDPIVDPHVVLSSKERVLHTHALVKPKDEPFTDVLPLDKVPQYEVPIAVIRPDSVNKENSSAKSISMGKPDGQESRASHFVAGEDTGGNVPASSSAPRTSCELATIPEESPSDLEIATSSLGEVKISLSCNSVLGRPNFHMPSQDELLKSMQEKCLRSYKILDPNFSVMQMLKDMCDCFLELATDSSHESQERLLNVTPSLNLLKKSAVCSALGVGSIEENDCIRASTSNGSLDFHCSAVPQISRLPRSLNGQKGTQSNRESIANGFVESDEGKKLGDPEFCSLVVVPQRELTTEELRSLHDLNDITKGEEVVEIPWSNEISNEPLPSFNYIPHSLVFQNAHANFTLSEITAENCCSPCIGDCLSSSAPCVCAGETGQGFAYTSEGLVKENFLEDCISMIRDPQQQCLSYCTDCPLERSRNYEILEPCKGHLKRKYIKECWSKCGCHKQCGNRVVQRGIRRKLQVFFTSEGKGWGLRTLEKLQKGAFVCEYVGEILTCRELYERNMQRTRNTERCNYPVLLDAYWCLNGVLNDEEALYLDGTFHGNVARFINHRCLDANLIEIPVKMETPDYHYYHLAFFTTREVDAKEELTWDYGVDFDDNDHHVEGFLCRCGSKFCRNMKRPYRSKAASRRLGI